MASKGLDILATREECIKNFFFSGPTKKQNGSDVAKLSQSAISGRKPRDRRMNITNLSMDMSAMVTVMIMQLLLLFSVVMDCQSVDTESNRVVL